jgi:hypothetical protein
MLRNLKDEQSKSDARSQFEALSQDEKLLNVITKGQSLLYSRGFKKSPQSKFGLLRHHPYQRHLLQNYKDELIDIYLLAFQGINKRTLEGVSMLLYNPLLTYEQALSVNRIKSFCLIGSLRVSRNQALAALLPSWAPIENRVFSIDEEQNFRDYKNGKIETVELEHTITMVFIDGIQSADDFMNRLRNALDFIFKG